MQNLGCQDFSGFLKYWYAEYTAIVIKCLKEKLTMQVATLF